MTDDERSGSCPTCRRRDPDHGELLCRPCQSRVRNQLDEIPELVGKVGNGGYVARDGRSARPEVRYPNGHRRAGELVPHFDQVANVLVSGPVGGRSSAPRVAGSREAPVPTSLDRLDLLSAARTSTAATRELAYPEQDEDQIGYLSAATTLDGWCRDIAPDRRESVPDPEPKTQCRWLLDRLDDVFIHPAVDELAKDISDLWHVLRRTAGLTTPKREPCLGIPCRSIECDLKTLVRIPGSDFIECESCGNLLTEPEYQEWCRMVRAPLCATKNGDWYCALAKKHDGDCQPFQPDGHVVPQV